MRLSILWPLRILGMLHNISAVSNKIIYLTNCYYTINRYLWHSIMPYPGGARLATRSEQAIIGPITRYTDSNLMI